MKALIRTALALLFLTTLKAGAQDTPQYIVGGMRPICMSLVANDMNGDIAAGSGEKVNAEKVCDCADARMIEDPVVVKVASLPKEQRKNVPRAAQTSVYVTVKYYSASLMCYAEAVSKSADKVLAR